MWEEVARAAAADADAGRALLDAARQRADRLLPDLAVRRRAGAARGTARHRPEAPLLLGHRRHDDAAARRRTAATRCSPASSTSRSITSAEALATQRAYKKRGERCRTRSSPTRSGRSRGRRRMHPVEVAHEVFQAWLTFAVFDNARRARLGTALDEYRRAIGEMMAPMTRVAAQNPDAWFPIARTADEIVDRTARQPHGRLPVHEVHGRDHGRRHGRRADRRDATSAPTRSACPPTSASTCAAGATRPTPCYVAEHPEMSRSPAMARRERGGAAAAPARHRRRRAPRPLFLLRELAALRARRARHRAGRRRGLSPSPAGCRTTAARQRVPHPLDRGDGRAAARRSRHARAGERRRHAHDEARVRRVLHRRPARRAARRARRAAGPRRGDAASRSPPSTTGDATVAAYSVVHGRDGGPEWALLVCDLPGGDRTYATGARPRATCARAEEQELVGARVRLETTTRRRADRPGDACAETVAATGVIDSGDIQSVACAVTLSRCDVGHSVHNWRQNPPALSTSIGRYAGVPPPCCTWGEA